MLRILRLFLCPIFNIVCERALKGSVLITSLLVHIVCNLSFSVLQCYPLILQNYELSFPFSSSSSFEQSKKMIHHITHKNPFKLQSPAPICMFYLSHPFGVVSPSSGSDAFKSRTFSSYPGRDDQIVSGDNDDGDGNDALYQRRRRKQLGEKPVVLNRTNARRREDWSGNLTGCNHDARTTSGLRDSSRMRSGHLIPWPRDTWRREFVLPPLIQFRGKQKGK